MEVIKTTDKNVVSKAITVLKRGGVVIFPTETCYGIGVDATNSDAVDKVIQFKGSNRNKPISVMVSDKKTARKYVEINKSADNLYRQFLPGPVTVVSKSRGKVCSKLESERKTLGIRIPDYPLVLSICRLFNKSITATSANQTGKKSPYSLSDVIKYTSKKQLKLVDLFIDAGRLPDRLPSTVVDTTVNEVKILRQGEINIKNKKAKTLVSHSEEETKQIATKILQEFQDKSQKKAIIFALQGELGSGKTQFAKGVAEALGVKDNVNSPTFTIIKEYRLQPNNRGIFYHIDTWRLEDGSELADLGLKKMIKPGNILAIEWQQKVKDILGNFNKKETTQIVWVVIDIVSETKRRIRYYG